MTNPMQAKKRAFKDHKAKHFLFETDADGRVATITLNRPEKKNPLTFESYEELCDLFRSLARASDVRAVVLTGASDNFSSGGDVFEIIEPLTRMSMPDLLDFTRMTGELVRQIRACPSRSSLRSTVSAPAPGRSWRWLPISAWPHRKQRRPFSSLVSGWRVPTWAPVAFFPASSARAARQNCFSAGG